MTDTETARSYSLPAPSLLDVVLVRQVTDPAHTRAGVVIYTFRQPHIVNGDRYRVEFRGGVTEWFWADELIVRPSVDHRDMVRAEVGMVRAMLHDAMTTAEGHDVLHIKLGEIFDALTITAATYLGGFLDDPDPAAAVPDC